MGENNVLDSMCMLPGARNVRVGFFGSFIRVAFDASQDYGPSSSGRTRIIASSCGNRSLGTSGLAVCFNAWYKEAQPAKLELLADGLRDNLGFNVKGVCQGKLAIFTVDLTVDGIPGVGGRVLKTIASTKGSCPVGESNVSVSLFVYVAQGKSLDLSGLPTTTSLSLGPWPGPGWVVTLEEKTVVISVDYSSVNKGSLQLKENIQKGSKGKKPKIIAEHGSLALALGDTGVNLTFQISTLDDSLKVTEERRDWVPVGAKKNDGMVQKGVFYRCCEGKLQFQLDPDGNFGVSTSGQSSVVATTSGRANISGTNMLCMINAFRKIPGVQRSQESKEIQTKKRTAAAKRLAIEKKAKFNGIKKDVAAEKILTAIAQKVRQVAKSRKGATSLASKSKKCVNKAKDKEEACRQLEAAASPADTSTAALEANAKADATSNMKADKEEDEDDDAPVTQLKRPLLPSKGVSEPLAKKACLANTQTNGKKDASGSKVAGKPSKKAEKVKSKKGSGIQKGAAMNHANVTAAVEAYMKKHPNWTFSLMKEEISEDYEWENGPKLMMFISVAKNKLAGASRGGNVVEGAL